MAAYGEAIRGAAGCGRCYPQDAGLVHARLSREEVAVSTQPPTRDTSGLASPVRAGPLCSLAAAVHDLWRRDARMRGWRRATRFDPKTKRHDALVPFERLDRDDQWTLIEILDANEVVPDLVRLLEYSREEDGLPRPLRTRDMRKGLVVETACGAENGYPPLRGEVTGWTTHPVSRRLETIRVKWIDGTRSTHAALECEIRISDVG